MWFGNYKLHNIIISNLASDQINSMNNLIEPRVNRLLLIIYFKIELIKINKEILAKSIIILITLKKLFKKYLDMVNQTSTILKDYLFQQIIFC